ncbi:hypothetical protein H1R20_g917, partial [Candolleomyces eurysporus]
MYQSDFKHNSLSDGSKSNKEHFETSFSMNGADSVRHCKRPTSLIPWNIFFDPIRTLPSSVLAIYLLVATLHLLSGLSQDDCSFTLRTLRLVFGLLLLQSTSLHAVSIPKAIHTDIRTVVKILDVQPRFKALLTCPDCSWVHYVDRGTPPSDYPEFCQRVIDDEPCGTPLTKTRKSRSGGEITVPVRQYLYQPMKEYLARLFSRPDLAEYLDRDPVAPGNDGEGMRDIWDGPGLAQLKGPDGKPFVKGRKSESRLVFSLNMDGFNPWGNREAGKKVSVGAIYMVCLNLPPSIRLELENMFLVGIVPGPHGPSNDEINFFLQPLVDDLLELWEHGVYLTRTVSHPSGRRVRCALGPLVCDLPAARQMSGFAHYRSRNFCSECDCTLDQINDSVKREWNPRTRRGHLYAATQWKEAKSTTEREKITKQYGVRWSELLRLPYWDPIQFTVIDSMHAFYLRLFQHHCQSVWGMDINFEDGEGVTFDVRSNQPTENEMKTADQILRHGTREMLTGLSRNVLRELCRQTSLPFNRNKAVLLDGLLEYRVQQKWFTAEGVHLGSAEDANITVAAVPTPGEQESAVLPNAEAIETFWLSASKTRLRKLVRGDLLLLFRSKVLPSSYLSEEETQQFKNPELISRLEKKVHLLIQNIHLIYLIQHVQRFEDGLTGSDGRLLSVAMKKTRVLGRTTLAEIRKDMARLGQPTWVARAPSNPGEKKWGKFTADQWKTFCMQNLPITLTRLWGAAPDGSTEKRRLDNFMHLVSAVKLATMYTVSESRIEQYEVHIRRYIETLLELYPGTSLTPYQHLVLHFGRQLRMFGPVHAWRCFAFERFNYVLQNFPTNERFGDIEKTMFTKFCCTQNLKVLYNKEDLPEALHQLVDIYEDNYASDLRGTRLSDVFSDQQLFGKVDEKAIWQSKDFSVLADEDFAMLREWMAKHHPENQVYSRHVVRRTAIHRFGHRFTTLHTSVDDSRVVFRQGEKAGWEVGSILGIFSHAVVGGPAKQTWALIQPFEDLRPEDTVRDHWRSYPVIGGCLFRNRWASSAVLVDVSHIRCHFAWCVLEVEGIEGECLLALPLNKVSL